MIKGLAVKAANQSRREYLPSYVGLRYLLRAVDPQQIDQKIYDLAYSRCRTGRLQRYTSYKMFKARKDGEFHYRDCFSPAPSASITEAFVLALLQGEDAFRVPGSVYSYLWPKPSSGHSYQFFLNGYKRKQHEIRRLLGRRPELYSIFVTDIEDFYPSSKSDVLMNRFDRRLTSTLIPDDLKSGISSIARQLFSIEGCSGIPIGSALGHLFGHIALETVDQGMASEYGENYLRYVDDIVVVAPKEDVHKVRPIVSALVAQAGYRLKEEKTHTIDGEDWRGSILDQAVLATFSTLRDDIILFLLLHPESFGLLKSALREEGFNLPVTIYRQVAEYSRFRRVALYLDHIRAKLKWPPTLQHILRVARDARVQIRNYYFEIAGDPLPGTTPSHEKWELQRLRWCLNRLLYLCPVKEYSSFLSVLPLSESLAPYKALLSAMIDRDAGQILAYPGATAASFAQLWKEEFPDAVPSIDLIGTPPKAVIDSLAVLGLHGILDAQSIANIGFESREDELLMKFASAVIPKTRELADLSYTDELRSLMLGQDVEFCKTVLETRFDDGELPFLDGLAMNLGGYS